MSKYPKVVSASAGSGKTHTITEYIYDQIVSDKVLPEKIIATTFTKKAARELRSRIREKLITEGRTTEANLLNQALIGTINSVCLQLLQRYAFEAGISPDIQTIDENDQKILLTELLGEVVDESFLDLADKLYQSDNGYGERIPYREHISKIITQLKANNLKSNQLSEFANESVHEYLSLYKGPIRDHESVVEQVLGKLKDAIDEVVRSDLKKSPKAQFDKLRNTYRSIKRNNFTWDEWMSLSKIKLANKYLPDGFKDEMSELIGDLLANSQFRKDYEGYITLCFSYAGEIINRYDKYKRERGVMDFMDQEAQLYELICRKSISQSIADAYDLVVVDEFQDVSPIQLAIFLRFADIVSDSVWVGDPKQSIYGFRGADPVLMNTVLNYIPEDEIETLQKSFRSREPLVHFTNHIFTQAFEGMLAPETITLQAADKNLTFRSEDEEGLLDPAVHYWNFINSGLVRKDHAYICLSDQIKKLIDSEPQVFDKAKRGYRKANYRDIAILCRSNRASQRIGQILSDAGMPAAVAGNGLIYEPEVIVITALLKLLIFPSDALAKAELLLHTLYNGDQSAMIEDRLNHENNYTWRADHPYLEQLKQVRQKGFDYAPSTTIEMLVTELRLYELYASWGELTQRISNVDALLFHAIEYQEMCNRLETASSIGGLLSHLQQLHATEEDLKGEQSGNAIQITTYHQSKGLEWPIVILWDLDHQMWDRYYGVRAMSPDVVLLNNPLAERRIKMIIKPFNSISKYERYDELIDGDPDKAYTDMQRDAEEKRLHYVAITRARDYLYLCGYKKFDLPEMIAPDLSQWALEDGAYDDVFSWKDHAIEIVKSTYNFGNDIELITDGSLRSRSYFSPKSGIIDHQSLRINPSSATALSDIPEYQVNRIHGRHYVNKSGINDAHLGDVIHSLICAYDNQLPEYEQIINQQLVQYGYKELIDTAWLHDAIKSLYTYIHDTYPKAIIHKELPIQSINTDGQLINGYIDMLVELPEALIIIDHKTFVIKEYNEEVYRKKAHEFSGQLELYGELLAQSFEKKVLSKEIYFVLEGIRVTSQNE